MIYDVSDFGKKVQQVENTKIRKVSLDEMKSILPHLPWDKFSIKPNEINLIGESFVDTLFKVMSESKKLTKKANDEYESLLNRDVLDEIKAVIYQTDISKEKGIVNAYIHFLNPRYAYGLHEEADFYDISVPFCMSHLNNGFLPYSLITSLTDKRYVSLSKTRGIYNLSDVQYTKHNTTILEEDDLLPETYSAIKNALIGNVFYVQDVTSDTYKLVVGHDYLVELLFDLYSDDNLVNYRMAKYIGVELHEELALKGYSKDSIFILNKKEYRIKNQLPNGTFVLVGTEDLNDQLLLTDISSLPMKTDILHDKINGLELSVNQVVKIIDEIKVDIEYLYDSVKALNRIMYRLTMEMSPTRRFNEELFKMSSRVGGYRDENRMWELYEAATTNNVLNNINSGLPIDFGEYMTFANVREAFYNK